MWDPHAERISSPGRCWQLNVFDRDHADRLIGTCAAAGIPATALRAREATR
jgi:hypothetical protein